MPHDDPITKSLGLHPGERPVDLLDDLGLAVVPPAPRSDNVAERPRIQGRPTQPIEISWERDLQTGDLEALAALPRNVPVRPLTRIHSSHHALARCLAAGMRHQQAALVTGYSPARIGALAADPAFQALVADYTNEIKGAFADLAERMANISLDAIEILQERLHDSPGEITVPMLLEIIRTMADRTGFGPGQSVSIKSESTFIDRPPRESFEEWRTRRSKELEAPKMLELAATKGRPN